jgi:hypothetical protein
MTFLVGTGIKRRRVPCQSRKRRSRRPRRAVWGVG